MRASFCQLRSEILPRLLSKKSPRALDPNSFSCFAATFNSNYSTLSPAIHCRSFGTSTRVNLKRAKTRQFIARKGNREAAAAAALHPPQRRKKHYRQAPDSGPNKSSLSITQIKDLLTQLSRSKHEKNFERTQQLETRLYDAGVFLDFSTLVWRADGIFHNYQQVPGTRNTSETLSDSDIHQLLALRLVAKRQGNYRQDNFLVERLNAAGVYVNEALKLWRADGIVPSSLEDQETDYKRIKGQGPNVTTLPDDEIWDLVTQRWRAKKSRDFERAETLETALETAGVLVDDHAREWRADGIMRVRGLLAKPPRPKQEEQPTIVPYTRSAGSGPSISLLPDDEIEELIMERLEARQDGDYEEADQILRALVAARVFVDDNFREWRSDGKRHCSKLTTTATSRSANATIEGDAQKFWSSGAVIGERAKLEPYTSSDSSVPHPSHDYVLAHDAGPNASKLSLDVIDKLLGERLQARIAGDFDAADQIRDELIQAGVFVDDKKKKWRADGVWHGYEQKGFNDSALSQGEIHARLANFQSTKIAGRYQEADEIRRELREYGVFIDDKLKQWRTTSLKSLSKDPPEELSAVA